MNKEDLIEWEFDCTQVCKGKSTYKEEYPTKPIDEYYFDQMFTAKTQIIKTFFTWYGIKCMDSWYSHHIKNLTESKYNKDQLIKFIKSNKHLHNVIKTNLLSNLLKQEQ